MLISTMKGYIGVSIDCTSHLYNHLMIIHYVVKISCLVTCHFIKNQCKKQNEVNHWLHHLNSLLPVSRYIDTAFADKGSHQKKNLQPKCPDTSKFGLLGKPTKKLELNPLFQSIFDTSKFQKLKKSCFFLFWKNIFLTPPPLNCLYLRPSISDFTNFFFAESVMDSSIILK